MTARGCADVRDDVAAGRVTAAETLTSAIDRAREVDAGHDRLAAVVDLEAGDLQERGYIRSPSRGLTCCSNT